MDMDGVLTADFDATSADGKVTIRILKGVKVLGPGGERLGEIVMTPVDLPPALPEGHYLIAAYDFAPDGATFDPGIEITIAYDPESLGDGVEEANLAAAFLDEATGEWVFVAGVVDTDANSVTFSISHFTAFAIIGRTAPVFTLSHLSISPGEVDPGDSVTISVRVANSGGMPGSYMVALLIDGAEEATQEVTLEPEASDTVAFAVTREAAGAYSVAIDGLTGEFTVKAHSFSPALIGGIVGGALAFLAVVAIAAYLLFFRRRRSANWA